MPSFARRFRRNAGLVLVAALVSQILMIVAGAVFLVRGDVVIALTFWGGVVILASSVSVYAITGHRRTRALRQVQASSPDGVVFLARRQPSVISDLATYVGGADDILDQVSDRWVVASVDERGMTAWSVEPQSRELILMPWKDVGSIDLAPLEDGRPGIAVDVKPFPTPLMVAVGYAAFGMLAPFGRRGVNEVIESSNALRP